MLFTPLFTWKLIFSLCGLSKRVTQHQTIYLTDLIDYMPNHKREEAWCPVSHEGGVECTYIHRLTDRGGTGNTAHNCSTVALSTFLAEVEFMCKCM